MKKKYVALMAGVGAAMAIGAPMAMAAELPAFEFPGAEPNGATCSFEPGQSSHSAEFTGESGENLLLTPPAEAPELPIPNSGNCEQFGNDQHNGEYSNGEYGSPQVPVQD